MTARMGARVEITNSELTDIAKALNVISEELVHIRFILGGMMDLDSSKKRALRITGHITNTEDRE